MVISMKRWAGKIAIVTGASAGCGVQIATQLVENGLIVVGLARRKENIEQLAEKLKGKPGKLHALKCDVSKEEEIVAAFKWVRDNLGPYHILINNAGIQKAKSLLNGDVDDWRQTFDVNVIGLCIATKIAVNDMKDNKIDGHIIHISSILGHYVLPVPDINVYTASKHAVTALTETLRQDLNAIGSKIRVSSVSPGLIETEFFEANNLIANKQFEELLKKSPKLTGEDIADACIYALSTPPHVQIHDIIMRPVGHIG